MEWANMGLPVAGNFYQAQWDAWVDQLWRTFNKFYSWRSCFALRPVYGSASTIMGKSFDSYSPEWTLRQKWTVLLSLLIFISCLVCQFEVGFVRIFFLLTASLYCLILIKIWSWKNHSDLISFWLYDVKRVTSNVKLSQERIMDCKISLDRRLHKMMVK